MTDLFSRLAERAMERADALAPYLPPRFAPATELESDGGFEAPRAPAPRPGAPPVTPMPPAAAPRTREAAPGAPAAPLAPEAEPTPIEVLTERVVQVHETTVAHASVGASAPEVAPLRRSAPTAGAPTSLTILRERATVHERAREVIERIVEVPGAPVPTLDLAEVSEAPREPSPGRPEAVDAPAVAPRAVRAAIAPVMPAPTAAHASEVRATSPPVEARPIVRVTIGRVEVRAPVPPPRALAPRPSAGPQRSPLDEYLRQRARRPPGGTP